MKLFKINFRINPLAEASRETQKALESDPKCRPLVQPFFYQDNIELNERKWDDKELNDTIAAFIRYDLQVLSVALAGAIKTSQKKGKPLSDFVNDIIGDFIDSLNKKLARGLDELKGDGGENKAAAKTLTTALKKIASDVSDKTFKTAINRIDDMVKDFTSSIGSGEVEPAKKDVSTAISAYDEVMAAFGKSSGSAKQAIDALVTAVKQFKAKKDLEKQILDIVVGLKKEIGIFEKYVTRFKDFENSATSLKKEIEGKKVLSKDIIKKNSDLKTYLSDDGDAEKIRTTSANARRELKKTMTDLKLK